jgi:hypothetical protein
MMQRILWLAVLMFTAAAQAQQGFPNQPIKLVVPFPPGGSTDTAARIIGERMRPVLGQTVIVENVGGAGGTIGVGRVARAAPDGYTIDIGQWDTHVGSIIYPLTYDLQKDFEPIGLMTINPQLLVAKKALPANTLQELVAWMKANPGMEIIAETNTPYNVAPAQEAVTNLLFNQPKIDGILSLGGALTAGAILAMDKQGRPMVPMTGENYRQFLELWKEKNLHAWATMQPNWLAGLAVYVGVQAQMGKDIPAFVTELVAARQRARGERRWKDADALRAQVTEAGFAIEDTAEGPRVRLRSTEGPDDVARR